MTQKSTLYQRLNNYPRSLLRNAEIKGTIPPGTFENILIYEDFCYLTEKFGKRKKGVICQQLADRYGYSTVSIRRKISMMAQTDIVPEIDQGPEIYAIYLSLRKHYAERNENQPGQDQPS